MKDIRQILTEDLAKNYQGFAMTVEAYHDGLMNSPKTGNFVVRKGDTLILTKKIENNGIEFHCINGERAKDLVVNVQKYLDDLKESGYDYAVTYYDNPRINELIKQLTHPYEINKIDDGLFRTYEAIMRFKWAH
jgi:hypothetical protein